MKLNKFPLENKKYYLTKNFYFKQKAKSNLSDYLIEIHKCPKDTWFQSLDSNEQKKDESETNDQPAPLAKLNLVCKIRPPANQLRFHTSEYLDFNYIYLKKF